MKPSFFGKVGAVTAVLGLTATMLATESRAAVVNYENIKVILPGTNTLTDTFIVEPYNDPGSPGGPNNPGQWDWTAPLTGTSWVSPFKSDGGPGVNAPQGEYIY